MVSVCMATYNGAPYINQQITSILSQLDREDELIISDDSSTDHTISLIKSITDSRIRLYENNLFRDPIKNFQNALSHANGTIIYLADQDDVWLPEKYKETNHLLKQCDLVISDSIITDENLAPLHQSFFAYMKSGKGLLKNVLKSTYYGSCMAFRRTLLEAALPFPDTKEIGHDLWIGLVAEMTGKVCFYQKPLILYRRHSASFTTAGLAKSKRPLLTQVKGRMIMMTEIVRFFLNNKLKWKKG